MLSPLEYHLIALTGAGDRILADGRIKRTGFVSTQYVDAQLLAEYGGRARSPRIQVCRYLRTVISRIWFPQDADGVSQINETRSAMLILIFRAIPYGQRM